MSGSKPSRGGAIDAYAEYKRTQMATGVHWTKADLNAIDAWIARQNDPTITRKVAVRRLVELGLKAKGK
jgi:hypothetical protein